MALPVSAADKLSSAIQKTQAGLKPRRRGLWLTLAVALVVVLVSGGIVGYRLLFAPLYKTAFLIDAAGGDLPSVVEALTAVAGNSGERDSQSLRSFGGECGAEDNTTRLVGFGTGNQEEIAEAARSVRQGAKATLQRGILEAVGDFTTPLALKAKQVNRIIVVTRHGEDACDTDSAFVRAQIRDRVATAGLKIEFRFVGYQVEDTRGLTDLAASLQTQEPAFATSPDELRRHLDWFANVEPVLRSSQSVVNVLNPAVEKLNTATTAIRNGRFDVADAALTDARDAVVDLEIEDLDSRIGSSADAVRLRDKAVRLRTLQTEVVAAAGTLIGSARSGEDLTDPLAGYSRAADAYNAEAGTMTKALTDLRALGPGGRR
ncbi:hypothetical protein SAMN04488074_12147 [Lentzea albidocapillata subsp. violacea]|uniref:Uncharacterized protein n=2 Tax=Lentzea albidocapillata TaxID=40571 RepID=A0A1G9T163_9PSEU|nr:hypothetical protein SAMN04488074_12147 [Lentzea albidocapillata subsp. violacea]